MWKVLAAVVTLALVMAGVEVAMFFAVRLAILQEMNWPLTTMAVLAAVLLSLGVMEQYLAIWRNRSVEGISFLFCGIDALGDVTSIISVAFERSINILGFAMYGAEFVLWCGVFACGFWFKLVPLIRSKLENTRRTWSPNLRSAATLATHATLHDMPSSTSVFRTAYGDFELRERPNQRMETGRDLT
jgi:hypothetical protein